MARLFGEELSGEQLRQRVGCLSQIAGASPFRYAGGRADGVRAVGVRTGSGLSFVVLLDRGLDIAQAEYCGQPSGWISKILYHYNFGFPVLSEHTRLYSSAVRVEPWNEKARAGNRRYDRFEQPTPGYAYQVFTHEMRRDRNKVYAALVNERMAFGAYLGMEDDGPAGLCGRP